MWAEVKKQTGTARQTVTTASARPASLKQMACRGRARLVVATASVSDMALPRKDRETHIQFSRIRPFFCPAKLAFRMAF